MVFSVTGYLVIGFIAAGLKMYSLFYVSILVILPIMHKQTMLYCFCFHVMQAKRNYDLLKSELVKIWEFEKLKSDADHPKWIE